MGTATFSYAAQDVQVSRRAGCPRATDALDNIRSADVGTRQYRYNYDANNLLLNIKNPAGVQQFAFTYDARGNTLTKTGQTFAFDYGNRLNEVTGSQVYRYDGQGRRVQTTDVADGKTTFWIYSQSGQVLYTSEARRNQNISYIYLGNTQVATKTVAWAPVSTTTIAYQHTDSLGSIVAETNASRVVVKRNSYEPYGGAWNSTIDGTGYTGHVMDQATGLTYMQQRFYDPAIGRFLSTDPMASDMNNAWNFNRYNYAANSPYGYTDPDGRKREGRDELGELIAQQLAYEHWQEQRREEIRNKSDELGGGMDSRFTLTATGSPGKTEYRRKWKLSRNSASGGWIVQYVLIEVHGFSASGEALYQKQEYWEGWEVLGGRDMPLVNSDIFRVKKIPETWVRGTATWTAKAAFFEGISKPKGFVLGAPTPAGKKIYSSRVDPGLDWSTGSNIVVPVPWSYSWP